MSVTVLPTVNAVLNASAALAMVLGFVAIRNRRSPSMSGTSFSTAIANENGSTNSVSAQTAPGIASVPPNTRL